MEFSLKNTMSHSAECLRKAVPLMVKYNIAVTPANYALWYSYVSGNHPKLNQKLDSALKTYGTCPPALSRDLFEEFLSDKDLELFDSVAGNISAVVASVEKNVGQTLDSAIDFSEVLSSCNQELDGFTIDDSSEKDILEVVNKLSEESKSMQQTAERFQQQLRAAYKEISSLRSELKESKKAASKDALTGLNNRKSFDEDLELLCNSHHSILKLYLTFVDIDHFKKFNDDFGHQKGDMVLKVVADRLRKHADQLNAVYRYGGEEFCILSQFKDKRDAVNYLEKIRVDIEKLALKDGKTGKALRSISASFGLAEFDGESCEMFIERADQALYKAKEAGRNCIIVA
ncbi:diguanylate cyclase [Pseudoalteromonas sp. G4]|uniref:diguanylate cyclase n=1 Tax=Pseudoalteromonas sp. G4 TaxID=2992761 RepID=UPI00237E75CD|nr:diguanylate cyclase [Pseudoalteromonas sp. G4]MDE3273395.1 GGDEF domain-containing protein [Pseudoalteromonas sp. G4]